MDKKELSQYRILKKEIRDLEIQIKHLENAEKQIQMDSVIGSNTEFPYQIVSIQIEGVPYNHNKIIELKSLLENKKIESDCALLKIQKFILNIKDGYIRNIFKLRYIQGKSWISISMDLGADYPEYARMTHNRYLNSKR